LDGDDMMINHCTTVKQITKNNKKTSMSTGDIFMKNSGKKHISNTKSP